MSSEYILGRLRCDSDHVSQLASHEGSVGHPGVKGRFRELLINNLLLPWLPPAIGCGTGIIIDNEQGVAAAGQEDVILFDPMLAPPILVSTQSTHGIYLYDSALCRIEVKSTLEKNDLRDFVDSSKTIASLRLAVGPGVVPTVFGTLNMLVAFRSDVKVGEELNYLAAAMSAAGLDPVSGIVSALCIAERGFWLLGEDAEGSRRGSSFGLVIDAIPYRIS